MRCSLRHRSRPVLCVAQGLLQHSAGRGGLLRVKPSAEGETLSGTFVKMPGSSEITFTYGEGVEYTATLSSYTTAEGARCARFTVDLTESYRTLYPDAGIESVVRYENTSHAAN